MHYLSQLLAWVRGALYGPRTPGRHSRSATPQAPPVARARRLAPNVLGARLVNVRRHHTERPTAPPQPQPQPRAEWFPPRPWEDTGAMVRPYVAHLGEERQHTLSARQFTEVSR